jgi:chemotaxis protein methyltransferase CheR
METEDIELSLLIQAVHKRYGHNLRLYAEASLKRRLQHAIEKLKYENISQVIPHVLHNEYFYHQLLSELSITVTEMFRDPDVFFEIQKTLFPSLQKYPYRKIWHAGCATGEEAYSLAILLFENNLLDNSTIFATDVNQQAIDHARLGIYNKKLVKSFEYNYQLAGGKARLSDYFTFSRFSTVQVKPFLRDKMVFARHDLTSEQEFSHVHLVFCRNVLIYFSEHFKKDIINTFKDSLYSGGYLCLGKRESLSEDEDFICCNNVTKLYQFKTRTGKKQTNELLVNIS